MWTLHHALRWDGRIVESQGGLETEVSPKADLISSGRSGAQQTTEVFGQEFLDQISQRDICLCIIFHRLEPVVKFFFLFCRVKLLIMTLLLGSPGSGKTTLLKAPAGKADDLIMVPIRYFAFDPSPKLGSCHFFSISLTF
ncbi:hypothetical protein M9H77_08695 [Catharanthus roseus]|uniref:Uncharacterized protein n=1 Tax=Catharanthus roseus TaxID=4058 RepID=A0ACC0BYN4_CATRO|nr:hypothetical protein M9H77_08695 [Catharanthus roseus]